MKCFALVALFGAILAAIPIAVSAQEPTQLRGLAVREVRAIGNDVLNEEMRKCVVDELAQKGATIRSDEEGIVIMLELRRSPISSSYVTYTLKGEDVETSYGANLFMVNAPSSGDIARNLVQAFADLRAKKK